MSKNTFIPTTKGLVSAHKSQDFDSGQKSQARTNISAASSTHVHGSITNDGKIGSTANLPVITGASGVVTAGSFGTTANTFCQGDDTRVVNAVQTTGSYTNPDWFVSIPFTKITGVATKAQQHTQTAYKDEANTWAQAQTFNGTVTVNNAGSGGVVLGNFSGMNATPTDMVISQAGAGSLYQDFGTSVIFRRTSDFATMATLTNGGDLTTRGSVNARYGVSISEAATGDLSWILYKNDGGPTQPLYLLDAANSRSHMYFTSASTDANASTYILSKLFATQVAEFGKGLNATGAYPHSSFGVPGVISYEYPYTRNFAGDGSGYTWAVSKRAGGVTTDIFTIYDASGDVNIKGNNVHLQGAVGGWGSQYAFKGSSGTNRGGFGAVGTSDTLDYYWIGPNFSIPHVKVSSSGLQVNSTGLNPASLVLSALDYPTAYTRINYDPNLADTQFTINYIGSSVYGGWKFQNLVGSTMTTKAEIKGNGDFVANAATFNGSLTITKTGSNGLIVNNTVGNALAIFNASAASVTDNAYWTIQTAGSDRWYVGQSVSALTGNFEIYGTAFGGSMFTLNRTTGAMTANAATFNGNLTATGTGNHQFGTGTAYSILANGAITNYIGNGGRFSIADQWWIYKNDGDLSMYIRDMVNSRMQMTFTPGASASAALTHIFSRLNVEGDVSAGSATFNGAVSSPTFRHVNSAGEFPWMLYSPGIDQSWYIRDLVNSRMQVTFTPGVDSTAAFTQLHSKLIVEGAATFNGIGKLGDYTVATLPSASANAGYEANVTDSSVTTFGSTVAGSGSSRVKVYSNGTNWTVQAA